MTDSNMPASCLTTMPRCHDCLLINGGFSIQIGSSNPFGRIPVDQAIKGTVNIDTQTPGGIKGFSLKLGAVTRYCLTSEYRSKFLRHLRCMVGCNDYQVNHPDI